MKKLITKSDNLFNRRRKVEDDDGGDGGCECVGGDGGTHTHGEQGISGGGDDGKEEDAAKKKASSSSLSSSLLLSTLEDDRTMMKMVSFDPPSRTQYEPPSSFDNTDNASSTSSTSITSTSTNTNASLLLPRNVVGASGDAELRQVLDDAHQQGRPVVVQFGAQWCEHCKIMLPNFVRMAKAHDEPIFVIANVDNCFETAKDVVYTPTFAFYKDKKKVRACLPPSPPTNHHD